MKSDNDYRPANVCPRSSRRTRAQSRARRNCSHTLHISDTFSFLGFLVFFKENLCSYLDWLGWIEVIPSENNFFLLWWLVHWQMFLLPGQGMQVKTLLSFGRSERRVYLGLKVFSSCEWAPRIRFSWTNLPTLQTRQPSMCLRRMVKWLLGETVLKI